MNIREKSHLQTVILMNNIDLNGDKSRVTSKIVPNSILIMTQRFHSKKLNIHFYFATFLHRQTDRQPHTASRRVADGKTIQTHIPILIHTKKNLCALAL